MFKTLFGSAESKEPSLLDRLKAGVQKTRAGLMEKLEDAVSGRKEINAEVLEELEYALITTDTALTSATLAPSRENSGLRTKEAPSWAAFGSSSK